MFMRGRGSQSDPWVLLTFLFLPCISETAHNRRDVTSYAAPIVVPSSQSWEGNDGPWSAFALQVGTPPQTVKVLASTASYQNWVIAPEGCQSGELIDCHTLRGELFNSNDSTTWEPNLANPSSNIYTLELETALGYTGKGRYGFDDLAFGYIGGGGPTIKNQSLAAIATKSFFLGLLGLTPRPSNFSTFNNPTPSFMQNLKNQSMIPSLSWAYTAGNQYREGSPLGSLILGGYDTSKFIPNSLSFPFTLESELPIQLQTITSNTTATLLQEPIVVYLDSTVPYMYLPIEACTLFENAFGLTWNETAQLYLLNDTQHTSLKSLNPNITFKLGIDGVTTAVDISLPYSAFDLTASWPLVANSTPYFPLRRAANKTQYMLGRTFFQEAYVIADYERMNFSVSQCNWNTSLPSSVASILPPSNITVSPSKKPTLSTAAIGGIGAGGAALLLVSCLALYLCFLRPRKQKKKAAELAGNPIEILKPELDGTTVGVHPTPIYEADGKKIGIFPAVEIGGKGAQPVYELPAREEVAFEAADTGRYDVKSGTQMASGRKVSRR